MQSSVPACGQRGPKRQASGGTSRSGGRPGIDRRRPLRTSSPIRITRNARYESVNTRGLYPAGEGAGYAGGILSAAVDGIEAAEAVALNITAGAGA